MSDFRAADPPPPARPEPLEALRARYPRALAREFDAEAIKRGQARRPGMFAANVLDCEDGIRLIISRERLGDGRLVLHFSASFRPDGTFAVAMRLRALSLAREDVLAHWRQAAAARFRRISGDARTVCFVGWSEGHVPHFVIEEAGPEAEASARPPA